MDENKPLKKPASKSQKMRFALFDLWSATIGNKGKGKPFDLFYDEWMDEQIEKIRAEVKGLPVDERDF